MRVAENGFFPWLFWAFFRWDGKVERLPYIGALLIMATVAISYTIALCFFYASASGPLPPDAFDNAENLVALLRANEPPLFTMLPITCMAIMLDAKRLRSMGFTPYISIAINVMNFLRPSEQSMVSLICALLALIYLAMLILSPAREGATEAASGASRRSGWPFAQSHSEATERGPRRLRGAQVKSWRVLAPAPQKK